jgi:hypothetical protein
MNNNEVYYIILEDCVLLSKKRYNDWHEIQDEYYDKFKTSIGPWTYEDLITYFEDDFGEENKWPLKKENIIDFFEGTEEVLYSDRD